MGAVPDVDVVSSADESIVHGVVEQSTSPFPMHCLPPVAQDMARTIVSATGVTDNLAGPVVLGVLSAAIGPGLEVQSGPHRTTRANLYICASSESGGGKSEAMRMTAKPIMDMQNEQIELHARETLPEAEAEIDFLNVEIANLKKAAARVDTEEDRLDLRDRLREKKLQLAAAELAKIPPTLTVEDTTVESLGMDLARMHETLTSLSADAGAVVSNLLGRYNRTDRTDETLYLKAWTGESYQISRVGRQSILLKRPWLSLLWCTQPDKIDSLLAAESLIDGGFIQRLLLCHSGCQMRELDANGAPVGTSPYSPEMVEAWDAAIRELLLTFRASHNTTARIIIPEPKALAVYIGHFNAIVRRCNHGELRDVKSFASRWTEQAWRIGLCLHAGLHGKASPNSPLAEEVAICACELANWFVEQQLAILAKSRSDKRRTRVNRLLTLLSEQRGEISLRDLKNSNGFEIDEVRRIVEAFPAQLTVERRGGKGRPSEVVVLVKGQMKSPTDSDVQQSDAAKVPFKK